MRRARALALLALASISGACNLIAGVPSKPDPGASGGAAPVTCNGDGDCDDNEPCTEDACGADKVCRHAALPDGPAADAAQKAGDCHTVFCEGGKSVDAPDDADVRDDGRSCTLDGCAGGTPTHVPLPEGMVCDVEGHTGRCSAQGDCQVICDVASDCSAPNPCFVGACEEGVCTFTPLPDGTPTPGAVEIAGDCHVHICVGGADTSVVDDSDVPSTDNDCDLEVCSAGVPSNPPKAGYPPCSTFKGSLPGRCDDAGVCRQCAEDTDCEGPSDDCRRPICFGFECGEYHAPAGTVPVLSPAQVPGDCQTIVCDGNGGSMVVYGPNDPEDDGTVCTTDVCALASVTQHNNVANGTICGVGGTLACVNGVCAGCTTNAQCPHASCSGTILTFAQTCDGMGNCVAPAVPTQVCAPFLCSAATNSCTTSCTSDAGCAQTGGGAFCNASQLCSPKRGAGALCSAPNQCKSGFCVDGRCCSTACNGTCEACSAMKKGAGVDGACGAIANGADPDGECAMTAASTCGTDGSCDGAGACHKYPSGTVCGGGTCAGTVLTKPSICNGSGTCTAPAPLTQDCAPFLCASGACTTSCTADAGCAPSGYCDLQAPGACHAKKPTGSACSRNAECVTGSCSPFTGKCG